MSASTTDRNPAMTDAAPDYAALAESEDVELEFEAPPPRRKSRRTPRKGTDTDAGAAAPAEPFPPSAAPARAAAEEPADPPAPVPQPGDASAGSAIAAPARDRRTLLLGVATGCAMLTSLMSLGGLIAVSRNLAALQADRAHAAEDRAALAHVPELVGVLDKTAARLSAPAGAGTAPVPAAPGALTADDLHRSLDELRLAMDKRQPTGVTALAGTITTGFSEIGTRLDRIEAAMQPRAPRPAAPIRQH